MPTAFGLDSTGTFLFAAGTASGRLASYRVDGGTGALKPLVGAEIPLAEIERAHELVESRRSVGKVVLIP